MDTMSETQTDATPGVDETVPQPATDDAPTTGQEQPAETTDETPEPKKTPWFQRRIDELTREKYEARRQVEAYADALRKIQQPAGQEHATNTAPPAGYVPAAEVHRAAAEMVSRADFNRVCDDIADIGSKLPDFPSAVGNLTALGVDTQNANDPFMQAVTALDKAEAARVFHELGSNP